MPGRRILIPITGFYIAMPNAGFSITAKQHTAFTLTVKLHHRTYAATKTDLIMACVLDTSVALSAIVFCPRDLPSCSEQITCLYFSRRPHSMACILISC